MIRPISHARYRTPARLSLSAQDALAIRAQHGDTAARDRLIESMLPVIAKRVSNISKLSEDREDYVQEAALHLFSSIDRYEPERGHFLAFALRWAEGGRRVWLHRQAWGRSYRTGRVAFHSLDAPMGEDRTYADTLPAEPDESVERESTRAAVREAIRFAGLAPQEKRLLACVMADGMEPGFQSRAADAMNLSRQRIGQLWLGRTGNGGLFAKLRTALAPLEQEAA